MHPNLSQVFLVLSFGGIVLALFIILLLNSKQVKKGRANKFLSVLLFALAFSIAHIFFAGDALNHFSSRIYSIGDPTYFLVAPLLWFYVCELTGEHIQWRWQLLLNFLPFAIIIILSLSLRSIQSSDFQLFLEQNQQLITILFWIVLVAQFSWVHVRVTRRWSYHQRIISQEVSNTENVSISWVRIFMIIFLVINLVFLISLVSVVHSFDGAWLRLITAVIFSFAIFALGYKGVLQIELFNKGESIQQDDSRQVTLDNPKSDRADLSKLNELTAFMEEKKLYLDAELTLTSLAREMGMTRGQLSLLINTGTGDNFYDFVNKYRVEEVKKLMVSPAMKNYNMLGLALEAGFKSKSTFNLIFKRFTGLTPSEYRKNLSAK